MFIAELDRPVERHASELVNAGFNTGIWLVFVVGVDEAALKCVIGVVLLVLIVVVDDFLVLTDSEVADERLLKFSTSAEAACETVVELDGKIDVCCGFVAVNCLVDPPVILDTGVVVAPIPDARDAREALKLDKFVAF